MPVIEIFARRCTLLKRGKFLFECKPFIQIIAPYESLEGESPGRPYCLSALHENGFDLIALLFYMGVPRQFAI